MASIAGVVALSLSQLLGGRVEKVDNREYMVLEKKMVGAKVLATVIDDAWTFGVGTTILVLIPKERIKKEVDMTTVKNFMDTNLKKYGQLTISSTKLIS